MMYTVKPKSAYNIGYFNNIIMYIAYISVTNTNIL